MMDILKRLVCVIFIGCGCVPATCIAQEFGGNPPSLKWNQYNTDTARVIFPVGLEQEALDVSRIVHGLAAATTATIGSQVRKIDIVMQNQTTVSNGYVALGPYRSEFFLTPTQNSFELGSLPWHKMLALHEYRHVQQNNNFRKGLSRALYLLFGEEGQALATSVVIPNWFWEGDAVFQETLWSRQGRGRLPFFYNDYRAIWAANKYYSWMKLRNGSLRDQTPDHYRLGFMLVSYGREKFGDSIWSRITDDAARFKGLFYPFQKAVLKYTGVDFPTFRRNAIDYFKAGVPASTHDSAVVIGKANKHFKDDEEFPQWIDQHRIVFVKSSYNKIPAFFVRDINSHKDTRLRTRDLSNDHYFSYRNGRIVYAAYTTDPRWRWRNFSDLRIVDVTTGKQTRLTNRSKYFSPDISSDGRRIVVVEQPPSGENVIKILEGNTGKELITMPNVKKYLFTFPKFFDADSIVAAVRDHAGEMALGVFAIRDGGARWLTTFTARPIAFPQVYHDTITFTQSAGEVENLFASVRGDLYRFTPSSGDRATGSYQLSLHGSRAVYSVFTAVGYQAIVTTADFERIGQPSAHGEDTVYDLPSLRDGGDLIDHVSDNTSAASRYHSAFHLLHFRSWRPFIEDPNYSYSIVSENILNTMQAEISATYNRNEKYKQLGASVSYAGWYPKINGGVSYTFNRNGLSANQVINWNELNANIGVSLPLSFVHGVYTTSMNASTSFNTQQVFYTGAAQRLFNDRRFNFGDLFFSFANQRSTARQHIYPHFAQTFSIRYRSIINRYQAHQLLLTGSLYLPGFSTNHSIVLQGAYQRRDTAQEYTFSNNFPEARGYANIDFPRMWKAAVNYHFPIAYPDAGFGNIVYILRLRGNAYYDFSQARSLRTGVVRDFNSAGAEIYADTKWWNELPVSVGIRYSRLLNADLTGRSANRWELVLPVNLLSR